MNTYPPPAVRTRDAVRADFLDRLNDVYATMQVRLGLTGDIGPWEERQLSDAQDALADVVAAWLGVTPELRWTVGERILTFDECEAFGLDGTGRDL